MDRGEFLAQKRREKGLSAARLAQLLGVSEAEVRSWEAGALPESAVLLGLSVLLEVPVEDILRGGPAEPNPDAQERPGGPSGSVQAMPDAQSSSGPQAESDMAGFAQIAPAPQAESAEASGQGEGQTEPEGSGHNGFSSGERKFGYVVLILFVLAAVLTADFIGWPWVTRELTSENYQDYITIRLVAAENFNADEYVLRVTAKRDLESFQVRVRADFYLAFGGGDHTETITLYGGTLEKGESAERTIQLPGVVLMVEMEVLSVTGGLA